MSLHAFCKLLIRDNAKPLPTLDDTSTRESRYTSMPRIGFEPTIPALERSKTVSVSDRHCNRQLVKFIIYIQ
jgi:hypothetical protein